MTALARRLLAAVARRREPLLARLALPRDLLDLAIRLHVANVFFASGLSKLADWDKTLFLFQAEYHVPLLSPPVAAFLGTAAEVALPVLLALGLATRFTAAALFLVNIVAVVSFWQVLGQNEAALNTHFYWGALLLVSAAHGPGRIALDHLLWRAARAGTGPAGHH